MYAEEPEITYQKTFQKNSLNKLSLPALAVIKKWQNQIDTQKLIAMILINIDCE